MNISIDQNEFDQLFETNVNFLKVVLNFCNEDVKEKTDDIIEIEKGLKIAIENQNSMKQALLDKIID